MILPLCALIWSVEPTGTSVPMTFFSYLQLQIDFKSCKPGAVPPAFPTQLPSPGNSLKMARLQTQPQAPSPSFPLKYA